MVEKSAGRVGQQGGILSSSRPNVLEYPPTLRFWMDRWSRDQPQPGCLFHLLREAEKRDPGNEVEHISGSTQRGEQARDQNCAHAQDGAVNDTRAQVSQIKTAIPEKMTQFYRGTVDIR